MIDQQIRAGLDERQRRIDEALNAGVEPTEIRKYENTINFLDSIKEENISDEGDKGEKLRKDLIYQDFINRGYSKERATREVQKSFNAGTDFDDAKEALKSNIDFFRDKYDELVNDAKSEAEEEEEERKRKEEASNRKGKVALDEATEKRLKEMEEKIANYEAKESKEARAKEVVKAMEKHKIPAYLRDRLAKSISDDEDIEDAVSAYKQELITNGLDDEHSGGSKAASEKQIDEAADSLLESITVK